MIENILMNTAVAVALNLLEKRTREVEGIDTDDLKKEFEKTLLGSSSLLERIKKAEGFRQHFYKCSEGVETIGFGRNISKSGPGVSPKEAEFLLMNDLQRIIPALQKKISCFDSLSIVRQEVLQEMCFQIGISGLKKFKKMLTALEKEDFEESAFQMMSSKWAKQTPDRARRLSVAMKVNSF